MTSAISGTQTTFLKGRNILNGVMVLNEVVDYARKRGKPCMIFKVDFEKANDSVSWEFLDYMLTRMGFDARWRGWISGCLNSASVSVLVNGSPTREFNMTKGIIQGDPMAHFLFLIVAERLNGLIRKAVECSRGRDEQIGISHVQYVDDIIMMGKLSISNGRALKCILKNFE